MDVTMDEALRLLSGVVVDLQHWSQEARGKARDLRDDDDPEGQAGYHEGRGAAYAASAHRVQMLERDLRKALLAGRRLG